MVLPTLDEDYVGKRLVKEFVDRKEVCYIGRKHALIMKILAFFPTFVVEWFCSLIENSDFENRKVKDRKEIRKNKK